MQGIYLPLMTPFYPNGELAIDKIEAMIEHHLKQGVHGFYIGGSSSECFMMTIEERQQVLKIVSRIVKQRVPLIAHVGAISFFEVKKLIECVAEESYQAISATPPFYYSFTQQEVIQHYKNIAAISPLPLLLYNIPATTGVSFSHQELFELAALNNVVGIKHTTTDMFFIERLRVKQPDSIIFHGEDAMLVNGLQMGASGGIGSTYNLMSAQFVNIYNAMMEGDVEKAIQVQHGVNEVIQVLVQVGIYQGIHFAMRELGVDYGECRKPFMPLNDENKRRMTKVLDKIEYS
ncbi:N-acetylneuraminate lyase [Vibrio sp. 99-8-1]|uniref:N-acetylneuraminate lyase n=1 Tax=Vibrio sp. 99-8-1 TaxID=2607602 RepID=UPI0014938EA5|nr:N-acetylneuraminate lyase [Vibrio sp. 99-8-1]NOI65711.1 N-acetylneuraminate lyase [Vibrio sp. 99-8-1]